MNRWFQALLLEVSLVSRNEHRLECDAFGRHLRQEFFNGKNRPFATLRP